MDITSKITNSEDLIDSRDVIARIEYLTPHRVIRSEDGDVVEEFATLEDANHALATTWDTPGMYEVETDEDEAQELASLRGLASEGEGLADWNHGETLIRDSYFEDYAQELADDIGAINSDARWPNNCIDWEHAARELQMDYTSLDFDGVTYWGCG